MSDIPTQAGEKRRLSNAERQVIHRQRRAELAERMRVALQIQDARSVAEARQIAAEALKRTWSRHAPVVR